MIWAPLLVLLVVLLFVPARSQAADMLICRDFARQDDKSSSTIHLHGNGVSYSGSDGNDKIYGTPGDDLLQGGNGNDVVYGEGGNDIVCGGTGNDRVFGEGGNDAVYGEEGRDLTDGGAGKDYVLGGADDDRIITWGDGADFADGDYGKDIVIGGADDQLFGGTLNDTISVRLAPTDTDSARYINGGYDDDRLTGTDYNDHIQGNVGTDRISGFGGDDDLRGGGSDDQISGGDGNDSIRGEDNSDAMHGDAGDDTLDGGEGDDFFWGDDGTDTCNWERKNEPLHSCEAGRQVARRLAREVQTGAMILARSHGGGPIDGQSGSARVITSDGYPFPKDYGRIAGYSRVATAAGGGLRTLDKDFTRSDKPNVVALGTVYGARQLQGVITSPGGGSAPVDWSYTNTCSRDYSAPDVMRSMSNKSKTPVRFSIKLPPKHGPKCDVAIWAKGDVAKRSSSLAAELRYR